MDTPIVILISVVSGGGIWEAFKFFYPEIKQPISALLRAKKSLYENLDPILKASSELYGKIESLAKEDFATFINPSNSNSVNPEHNKKYIYYLFAQFWAQLEYFRLESQYTAISRIKKGKQLLRFIETYESREYRILDRSIQRVIGECLLVGGINKFRIMSLNEFLIQLETPGSNLSKWIELLEDVLCKVKDKKVRQKILVFGVIVAALIDNFDPKYKSIRRRDIYINKLSPRSKRLINTHLVKHYLSFIKKKERYY